MELTIAREVTTNIKGATSFGVTSNSAKLFSMLSNMLYKNKERSVLTELSSNAIDAHKMAGKEDVPIKVVLPTSLSPEVRVRDYGHGLSDENVVRFLTTYGESNKQQSNDFIGGFGIGSKSPAAVTDTWSIHSYHEGVHRQYIVFISSDGVPSLKKILENATTESGLEVVIPVKEGTQTAWNNAAVDTYLYYPVRPKLHNMKNEYLLDVKFVHEGKEFNLSTGGDDYCSAIINHRSYSIDRSKIIESTTMDKKHQLILSLRKISFKFTIGELSLSLSREDVQYDKRTIAAIAEKCKAVFEEHKEMFDDFVAPAKSELEFFTLSVEFFHKYISVDSYSDTKQNLYIALAHGNPLYSKEFEINTKNITIDYPETANVKFLNAKGSIIMQGKNSNAYFGSYNSPSKYSKDTECTLRLHIDKLSEMVFVVSDCSMINLRVKAAYPDTNVVIADHFDTLPEFLKSKVVLGSSLPKPTITRTKKDKIDSELFEIDGRRMVRQDEKYFLDVIANNKRPMVYVRFTKASSASTITTSDYIMSLLRNYRFNIVCLKVDGEVPSWAVTPEEALKEKYEEYNKIVDSSENVLFMSKVRNFDLLNCIANTQRKTTKAKTVWNEFLDVYNSIDKTKLVDISTVSNANNRCDEIRAALNIPKPAATKASGGDIIDKVKDAYPLLEQLGYINLTAAKMYDSIMLYVNAVGK